ncbi:MAG: acyl-CoA thioesterase [Anaerolineaceae bacterium]|nr:acyl-CoA thioesterase [Anaerolineaceae bacterium]
MQRTKKRIEESRFTLSALMGPQNANSYGNVHGGVIMKMVDEAGALVAMRHARTPVVTVAVDSMSFIKPIFVGSLVMCEAELTYVGRTSMEVRVEVKTENPRTGERSFTNTAYLVYVALSDDGNPTTVPELIYETPEQQTRAQQAQERQNYRKQQRQQDAIRL